MHCSLKSTAVARLDVKLEWQRSEFQEIVACGENLADRIGKSQRDRLTVIVDAGVEIRLGKTENVTQHGFKVTHCMLIL
jgi:hypothetical protein